MCFFSNVEFLTNDAEHCTFEGYHKKKTSFFIKSQSSAKNHSNIKPVKYAQELEVPINPVTFHSNCFGSLRVVRTNFKIKII